MGKLIRKGQASVELMIILAAALVVLIAIYSYSSQSVTGLNRQKLIETAKTSVNDLKNAANDVFAQGVGAKKQVYFVVPNGVNQPSSGIIGQSIVLNLLGSDIYAKANTQITGQIPTTPGGHWVWVTAFENYVAIGAQNVSADKTSSYATLPQSSSIQDSVNLSNNGTENASVTITNIWANTNVMLGVAPQSFVLNAGAQQAITLTYTSNAAAAGNYSGSLEILADFPTASDENISIPANAEVIPSGGSTSSIIVLPLSYSATIEAGSTNSSSFSVCNNSTQAISNISFTKTGAIAGWITPEPIATIPSLGAGLCQQENFTITIAGPQAAGTYNGSIIAASGANSDSIDLTVQVIPQQPRLSNVDVLLFSNSAYTSPSATFNQGMTVFYEIRTFDQFGSPLDVTDLNVKVTDPASALKQSMLNLSTASGKFQGSYPLALTDAAGIWRVQADANKGGTVSDFNNFTTVYYPFLSNVDVLLFSNAAYTTPAVTFVQGNTVYYEIRTFDQFAAPLNLTDLNVKVTDPLSIVRQNLTGLFTSSGIYRGSYGVPLAGNTGIWAVSADANKNNKITDTNNFTVNTLCTTQAACFSQSWNGAGFTCLSTGPNAGRYCQLSQVAPFWTISNTSTSTTLTITQIMVTWAGDSDGDTSVDDIYLNNVKRNASSSTSGAWNNTTDFPMAPGQTFSTNNFLRWIGSSTSGFKNNQTETYTVSFGFSDASTYTTSPAYNPPP